MKKLLFVSILFISICTRGQSVKSSQSFSFSICGRNGIQHIDSMIKCHRVIASEPNVSIASFEAIFNTVAGVTIHTTTGDEFNADMMEHLKKDKPLRIYLNIKAIVSGKEQQFKDIEIRMKYK